MVFCVISGVVEFRWKIGAVLTPVPPVAEIRWNLASEMFHDGHHLKVAAYARLRVPIFLNFFLWGAGTLNMLNVNSMTLFSHGSDL